MTEKEQINHFAREVDALLNRFRSEYELSMAAAIGVLQLKVHLLCQEADEMGSDDPEDGEDED